MNHIQVGDQVICIDNADFGFELELNKIYKITCVIDPTYEDSTLIKVERLDKLYSISRFQPIKTQPKTKKNFAKWISSNG